MNVNDLLLITYLIKYIFYKYNNNNNYNYNIYIIYLKKLFSSLELQPIVPYIYADDIQTAKINM